MALIGSIAINMSVRTAEVARGLARASRMLASFRKSASRDILVGAAMVARGVADAGKGMAGLGLAAAVGFAAAVDAAGKFVAPMAMASRKFFAPLTAAAMAAVGSATSVYGRLGAMVARAMARGSRPMAEAIRVTARMVERYPTAAAGPMRTALPGGRARLALGRPEGRELARRPAVRDVGLLGPRQLALPGPSKATEAPSVVAAIGKSIGRISALAGRAAGGLGRMAAGIGGIVAAGAAASLGGIARGVGLVARGSARAAMGLTLMAKGLARLAVAGTIGGLKTIGSTIAYVGRSVAHTFQLAEQLASKLLIIGGIGAAAIYKAARAASSLAEQTDRARVLFGDAAAGIVEQANVMGEAFGVSRSEFVGAASEMGGMLEGVGYKAADAAKMGARLATMAMDVSSATQMDRGEVMQRMASGLAGQSEAVRRWGINIEETNLKLKMLKMGMVAANGEFSQSQKEVARLALMEEGLAKYQGNLALTADGAENSARGLMGRLNNLAETIGTALLPIVGSALTDLGTGVQALSMAWKSMTAGVVSDQVGVIGAVGETARSMGWLQKSVGFVADSFQNLRIGFYSVQSSLTAGISKIVSAFAYLGNAIDFALGKLGMARTGIGDYLKTYGEDLAHLSESQFDKASAIAGGPAASEGVDAAFAAARDRIRASRAEAMKPGVKLTDFKPTGALEAGGKAKEFASASALGSSAAANAILRSKYGARGDARKPEELTAKYTGQMAGYLKDISAKLGNAGLNQATESVVGSMGAALGIKF